MDNSLETYKQKYIKLRDTIGISSVEIWQQFLNEIYSVMPDKNEEWIQLCVLTEIKIEESIEEYNHTVDEYIEIITQKDDEDKFMFAQLSAIEEYNNPFD